LGQKQELLDLYILQDIQKMNTEYEIHMK